MIGRPDWDEFVSANLWAVLTTLRKSGQPSSSAVAYARDGDELLVSTTRKTLKVRTLERDPRVNLCVIDSAKHVSFVAIEGVASIERSDLVAPTLRIFERLRTIGYPEPPDLPGWLEKQGRVIVRIRPERVTGVIVPRV